MQRRPLTSNRPGKRRLSSRADALQRLKLLGQAGKPPAELPLRSTVQRPTNRFVFTQTTAKGASPMRREQLTEKILDIKREKGLTWKQITDEIGGMSPVLVVGALMGQMKLVKPLAKKAAALFGLSEAEERMLNEIPYRGTQMPPTDPLIYRFYEMVM